MSQIFLKFPFNAANDDGILKLLPAAESTALTAAIINDELLS